MRRQIVLFATLVLLSQALFVQQIKSNPGELPQGAMEGRYNLYEDRFWVVYNKTVQQLRDEGYEVLGNPDWPVQANYTRLGYTFKSKIVRISWPNLTIELIEGEYDLNVTAYRILENGSIGEKLGSFMRENQPARMRSWETEDPDLGVMFNPSVLIVGNNFSTRFLEYRVNRTEILAGTPWGHNETYVVYGYSEDPSHQYNNTLWCDIESGIFLKVLWDTKISTLVAHEEMRLVEAGIEDNVGVDVGDWAAFNILLFEWASNITGQEQPPSEIGWASNVTWTDVEVLDVLGSNITARSTAIYENGTEQTWVYWGSIATGEGGLFAIAFIPVDLSLGDKIPARFVWFTQEPLELFLNGTGIRRYAGSDREVNYAIVMHTIVSNTTHHSALNMTFYWDKKTGFICEYEIHYSSSFIMNSTYYYLNWSILERMTATNMWQSVMPIGNGYAFNVTIRSNSTILDFDFNDSMKQISFNVRGPTGKAGYCDVAIPDDMLWGDFSVYMNGSLLVKDVNYTQTHNGTHYIFHITFIHSTHAIEIRSSEAVPEIPSLMILPLFMITTLLAAIVYIRKHSLTAEEKL